MKRFLLWNNTLIVVTFFAVAMGLFESAVVVYLREIYYPDGFDFQITPVEGKIMAVEVLREFATLIMLMSVGFLAGQNRLQKFAFFIFSFAVWDIFYYLFLKLFINWPDSFFTWDILFLIPVVWIAPVICPLIISLAMIVLALIIIHRNNMDSTFSLSLTTWIFLIAGSIVLVLSFTWGYSSFVIQSSGVRYLLSSNLNPDYVPQKFRWLIFVVSELLILTGILMIFLPKFNKK